MSGIWTPEEVRFYQENGYLLYHKPLFSAEMLGELTELFEEQLAQKGSKLSDELDTPHFREERLLKFLLSDEVLDVVEPLIGPDIGLWSSHFICKDAYTGRATPWHEDSSYWKGRINSFDKIVTVWLALDRSTEENGCMRVIPGSHRNGGFSDYEQVDGRYNLFGSQVKNVEESNAVSFELERGECSLHDARIIHGAKPNTSPFRRCGYTMRYFSTELRAYKDAEKAKSFTRAKVEHKLWLARGRNIAGSKFVNE
ncbi:phytanoyl-CoA dioxygenase family protein [Paenibacillus sp. CC-CFT747]|nr:phytanoyl-CoA dioxygenase family protein [Paenibacillus sp. CC-CFT747]